MKVIKFIRIFLLVLIIIGIGLMCTQKIWVPKLVQKILSYEEPVKVEAEKDFEGEADPSRMTLGMKAWVWMAAKKHGAFTLTLADAGRFSATTDCNSVGGIYMVNKNSISFSKIFSTEMYCKDSQESDFVALLESAKTYHFTSWGQLIFDTEPKGKEMVFR